MAAAAIPLIASAVSALLPMIPNIVQAVEGIFGAKTGPDKLKAATEMVKVASNQMATAGSLPGIPDDSTLTTMVETVVQQMIAGGQIPGKTPSGTPAPTPASSNGAATGQRITITGVLYNA